MFYTLDLCKSAYSRPFGKGNKSCKVFPFKTKDSLMRTLSWFIDHEPDLTYRIQCLKEEDHMEVQDLADANTKLIELCVLIDPSDFDEEDMTHLCYVS